MDDTLIHTKRFCKRSWNLFRHEPPRGDPTTQKSPRLQYPRRATNSPELSCRGGGTQLDETLLGHLWTARKSQRTTPANLNNRRCGGSLRLSALLAQIHTKSIIVALHLSLGLVYENTFIVNVMVVASHVYSCKTFRQSENDLVYVVVPPLADTLLEHGKRKKRVVLIKRKNARKHDDSKGQDPRFVFSTCTTTRKTAQTTR